MQNKKTKNPSFQGFFQKCMSSTQPPLPVWFFWNNPFSCLGWMFFTCVFDFSFSGDQPTLSASEVAKNTNKTSYEANLTLEDLQHISLNILENSTIYDLSATITQDESDLDVTYDPDSDMDNSESEVDGIDELALGLVYLHHFLCFNASNQKY